MYVRISKIHSIYLLI